MWPLFTVKFELNASSRISYVIVVTDAGWITEGAFKDEGIGGVALKGQENWEIFRRLALWASGR